MNRNLSINTLLVFSQRLLQSLSGLIYVYLLANYVTLDEQGWYYVFLSFGGLYTLFDLGLSTILVQYFSRNSGDLNKKPKKLLEIIFGKYIKLAVGYKLIVFTTGLFYFTIASKRLDLDWLFPWFMLTLGFSLQLLILPLTAYLEGIGFIRQITLMRIVQISASILCATLFFINSLPLLAAASQALMASIIPIICICTLFKPILFPIKFRLSSDSLPLDINRLKSRVSITWLSNYMSSQLFPIIILQASGASSAGLFSLTMVSANTIGILALSQVASHVSQIAYTAASNISELKTRLDRDFIVYTLTFAFLSVILSIAYSFLPTYIKSRFLQPAGIVCVFIYYFVFNFQQLYLIYTRSTLIEPSHHFNIYSIFVYLIFGSFVVFNTNVEVLAYYLALASLLFFWTLLKPNITKFKSNLM